MNLIKNIALIEVRKKIRQLHKNGLTVEQIKVKFYDEPKVVEGLAVLGIDDKEFTEILKKEIK